MPVQLALLLATLSHNRIHMPGSFRGGKTVGALLAMTLHGMRREGGRYLVAGRSVESVTDAMYTYFEDIAQFCQMNLRVRKGYRTMSTKGGAEIHFTLLGAADERATSRVQGRTYDGALVDEVSNLPQSFYYMVLTRISRPGSLLITTCNTDAPSHWYKTEVLDRAEETGDYILEEAAAAIYDNVYLPDGFVEGLEKSLPPHMRQRGLLGQWVPAEGLVYPEYHMWEQPLPHSFWHPPTVGVDYGHGDKGITGAVALSWYGDQAGSQGIYIAHSEYRHQGPLDPNEQARRILQQYPKGRFVVDYTPAPLYQSLLQRAPNRTLKAEKMSGSVLEGINHLQALLQSKRLLIHSGCENLRAEMAEYVWSSVLAPVTGADRPVKRGDHLCDALRYAAAHIVPAKEYIPDAP